MFIQGLIYTRHNIRHFLIEFSQLMRSTRSALNKTDKEAVNEQEAKAR